MDLNNEKEINEKFSLAVNHYKNNNFQKAIVSFKEIISLNSKNINAYLNLGAIFFKIKNFKESIKYYEEALKINPNHVNSYNNVGVAFREIGNLKKALENFKNIIRLDPNNLNALNNLGLILIDLKDTKKSKQYFQKVLEIEPNHVDALNNIGIVFKNEKEYENSINSYKKIIKINPKYINAYYNLGCIYKELKSYNEAIKYLNDTIKFFSEHEGALLALGIIFEEQGKYDKALEYYNCIIKINSTNKTAVNNAGVVLLNMGRIKEAKSQFKKALKIDPSFIGAHWNLCGTVNSVKEVSSILDKILEIDPKQTEAKILAQAFKNLDDNIKNLKMIKSDHHYSRSVKWFFSLPNIPKIFFNRWALFNEIIKISDKSRPFYEFGVWNGISFKYLKKFFKQGYGFDTFEGIPDTWHKEPKGSYSSYGQIPKIKGGNFVVGKFQDELPKFFSKKRPKASLINFDADLYSSTICALENCKEIIDKKTILVFDEFFMNKNWEEDEFKAINEFCEKYNFKYKVIAVSFFSKQVAVRLT